MRSIGRDISMIALSIAGSIIMIEGFGMVIALLGALFDTEIYLRPSQYVPAAVGIASTGFFGFLVVAAPLVAVWVLLILLLFLHNRREYYLSILLSLLVSAGLLWFIAVDFRSLVLDEIMQSEIRHRASTAIPLP